ncbi:hypothetical protein TG4357_01025 [Thalassovita gelatinovora]|uniref:Uncharacterized protein n=1 Tax=Thalassovita gelatinovora TaxID=53501 RepID=A0A0P1F7V7_THAGE|nr:hypothetical protein [Thalassovita gelatinovora]QIZ80198.1 hypothetical protein HFZ77_06785 [Thalassovita gelatinovora]CUH64028.1 hypothetical protein TG4357_01025 [Thalassovita gelatinovora]SEQ81899.1 hypothetical protein SAMN04488043_10967 [Thalassovita gelatinovora]
MEAQRLSGHAPRTTALGQQLTQLNGPCIGCSECQGLCRVLIDMVTIPDILLHRETTA